MIGDWATSTWGALSHHRTVLDCDLDSQSRPDWLHGSHVSDLWVDDAPARLLETGLADHRVEELDGTRAQHAEHLADRLGA